MTVEGNYLCLAAWLAAVNISGRTAPTTQKMLDFPKSSQYIRPILLKLSKCSEAKKKKKKNLSRIKV